MTKCGHIFCKPISGETRSLLTPPKGFPCLLHYLELGEGHGQKARSCPICFDVVYARELKSVKWFDPVSAASQSEASTLHSLVAEGTEIGPEDIDNGDAKPGDYITMRLIHRSTISTLALPRSPTWPSELMPPHAAPWHFAPDVEIFSRFMLATPDYMTAELKRDIRQLEGEIHNLRQLGSQADDLGLVFVEAAQRKVLEQIEKVSTLRTDQVQRDSEAAWFDIESLRDKEGAAARRREYERERALAVTTSASETEEYIPPEAVLRGADGSTYRSTPKKSQTARTTAGHPSALPNARNNRTRRNLNPPPPNDATYLFYQASSGQHIYLHPLDIKILKSHFESYSAFPLAIRVKVDGTEEGSMNDDLRKKCRYLAHLPSACDITFVEADLSEVISPEALAPYSQALKKRAGKRKDKAKKDDRARVRAEQAAQEKEREALGTRSRRRDTAYIPHLSGEMTALQVTDEDFPLSTSPSNNASALSKSSEEETAASQRTVWGTRAVQAAPGSNRQADYEYEDQAVETAWNDFDMMQQRGGRRQGRKKKVVLNLSGGAVSMRR